MHELSVAQSILEIASRHLPAGSAARVSSVRVRIGDLAGVVPESLEFCFEAITAGTRLEGARLVVDRVPVTGECPSCGRNGAIPGSLPLCPDCGAVVRILAGVDMQVAEMELEE